MSMWLVKPHTVRTSSVVAMLVPMLVLSGCTGAGGDVPGGSGGPAGNPATVIDYGEAPTVAAARLASAMAAADSPELLRPLAEEALARTGMAVVRTVDAADQPLAPIGPRDLGMPLSRYQVQNLVLDHLEGQGWTLADLTHAIAEHPAGPGAALLERPTAIGRLLREWVLLAEAAPTDPESFAPLLLAGLARARGGPADFTTGPIRAEAVPLSTLELALLTGGAMRSGSPATAGTAGSGAGRMAAPAVLPAADDKGPCAAIEKALGKEAQDFAEEGSGGLFDKATKRVRDWLSKKGDGALAGGMKSVGGVLQIANLLTSLMAMYGGYSLTLSWDPAKPHYLGYDGGHGDVEMTVTANVSTRPQADDATLACLKFLGIEKPDSEAVKDTTVAWRPLRGTPKHAIVTSKDLMRMAVSAEGKARLTLAMTAEKSTEAGRTGTLKHDQIVIQADLTTYKSTPSKIAAAALFGGTVGGSIESGKGWFNSWFPKRAVATIPVEWHQLPVWRGVVDRPDGTSWVFLSGQGAKSHWTVKLAGGPVQAGPMRFKASGKATFNLTSGSASATLLRQMTGTLVGRTVTIVTELPMTIELAGTDEAPTLTVTSQPGRNVVSVPEVPQVSGEVEAGGTTTVTLTEVEED